MAESREQVNANIETDLLNEFLAEMGRRGIRKKQDALSDAMRVWIALPYDRLRDSLSIGLANGLTIPTLVREAFDTWIRSREAEVFGPGPLPWHQSATDASQTGVQRPGVVPSAEQAATAPTSDILAGLSEADRETALKAIQVLREGPEAFKGLILGGVQAWETLKNDQQGQGVRAVGEKPSRAKVR
jgi:hypothetical protein